MSTKIAGIEANQVFGFATIIAAINGIKDTIVVHPDQINGDAIFFFILFFIMRFKMYVDDMNHNFPSGDPFDPMIAIISWIIFTFSAASISENLETAIYWMIWGLYASTIWGIYSMLLYNRKGYLKYLRYTLFNIIIIMILNTLSEHHIFPFLENIDSDWHKSLMFLCMILVILDWALGLDQASPPPS